MKRVMKGFRSLTTRLSFWILFAGGAVFAATIWASNRLARETAIRAAEQEARRAARTAASRVQEVLRSVEETTELLGATVESLDPEPTALKELLRRFVTSPTPATATGRSPGTRSRFERRSPPGRSPTSTRAVVAP